MVSTEMLSIEQTIPAGSFCPDVDVYVRATGVVVTQVWTAGEIFVDETLFKSEAKIDNSFTNSVTGKSVTLHQADVREYVIEAFELVELTSSGTSVRVVIPGEGLLEYFIGHVKVSFDFTTTPPTTTSEFHGIESSGDLCALIS